MKTPKPLRMAPAVKPVELTAEKAMEGLKAVDAWTEEPASPPAQTASKAPPRPPRAPKAATPKETPVKAPEPPKKPWELVSPDKVHPYQLVMSEKLWLMLDHTWKRKGYASAKEYILLNLEQLLETHLKELS